MLFFIPFFGLATYLMGWAEPTSSSSVHDALRRGRASAAAAKVVFLGCNLSDEDLIVATAGIAGSGHPGPVVLDTSETASHLKGFLDAFHPEHVIPMGRLSEEQEELEGRLGRKAAPALEWEEGPPKELWKALFPRAERVVVCPAEPRRLVLHAACLAGIVEGPLYVMHGRSGEATELRRKLPAWDTREVFVIGETDKYSLKLPGLRVVRLAGEREVAACYLRRQRQQGPISTLIVANPADVGNHRGGISALAPWIALQKRAALLLTNDAGDNTDAIVLEALQDPRLEHADALILVAGLKAIPPERRPNPAAGKDEAIEMEPLTPTGSEPFSFATGRLFHRDAGMVLLMLARQRLLSRAPEGSANSARPRKAMVVSNAAGGLSLLEAFSRNTANELRNVGYQTTTLFGNDVSKDEVRRLLPLQDVFLWEGHHNTMARTYELPDWPEPLPPALVFLQSCLALCPAEAYPLLQRGAIGVVGSSTRTYSASGGACSLAFFNALLYENQSLGGSLRQAKNFLLAYALLKEKRLGEDAKLRGANLRSAWAFSLWGDPTLKLPQPEKPPDALPAVRHQVHGNTITLWQPDQAYDKVASNQYHTRMIPNARLAGLLHKEVDSPERQLVPFLFAEVHLPRVPFGKTPRLHSRVPVDHWVFCWDSRRRRGYLLVAPRPKDTGTLRFHVGW